MREKNKIEIIIGFLVFWTFCFLNGFFNPLLSKNLPLFYSVEIFFWVIFPILNIVYLTKITMISTFAELGFQLEIFKKRNYFFLVFVSFIFAYIVQYIYFNTYTLLGKIFPINYLENFDYETTIPKTHLEGILLTLYYSITAGIVEEIYYRAILANLFQIDRKLNLFYIFMSSFLFSINHWEGGIINLIDTFLYGLIFSLFYNKFRNIWPLIIAHIITDIIAFYPKELYN